MTNLVGLFIAVLYIVLLIIAGQVLHSRYEVSGTASRKLIHIGVGMLSWGLSFLFDTPYYFVAACLFFAVINLADWRFGLLSSMASQDRSNLGTVYFPLVAAGASLLFWERQPLLVAALMPMTWGDGLAPLAGKAFGRINYGVLGTRRTVEGSIAFFITALLSVWFALVLIPGSPDLVASQALLPALIIAAATTLIEASSPWGLDNLTITAGAMAILASWPW